MRPAVYAVSAASAETAPTLGLDELASAALLAAVEIARRRLLWEPLLAGELDEVLLNRYLRGLFGATDQEILGAVLLGTGRNILGAVEVFRGRLTESAFDPKPFLREALCLNASGVLLVLCQPKADSAWRRTETRAVAERAHEACAALGLELVDFRILGTYFVSLREEPHPKRQWVPKAELLRIVSGLDADPDFREDIAALGGTVGQLEDPWESSSG